MSDSETHTTDWYTCPTHTSSGFPRYFECQAHVTSWKNLAF